jgi:hypothetical protein
MPVLPVISTVSWIAGWLAYVQGLIPGCGLHGEAEDHFCADHSLVRSVLNWALDPNTAPMGFNDRFSDWQT